MKTGRNWEVSVLPFDDDAMLLGASEEQLQPVVSSVLHVRGEV